MEKDLNIKCPKCRKITKLSKELVEKINKETTKHHDLWCKCGFHLDLYMEIHLNEIKKR